MRFGLLLPHFGAHADLGALIEAADEWVDAGFASVWVRDHLLPPTGPRPGDDRWLDPFVVLAAVGARDSRLTLGTAVLVPYRHPLVVTALAHTLGEVASHGGVILGLGAGTSDVQFSAAGLPVERRGAAVEEYTALLSRLLCGDSVEISGPRWHVSAPAIASRAAAPPIPLWYGGVTPRAAERAALLFDGLLLSRAPTSVVADRIGLVREQAERAARPRPSIGVVGLLVPGSTQAEARRSIDVERLEAENSRYFRNDPLTVTDPIANGSVLAGSFADIAARLDELSALGVDHVVFDLRYRVADWFDLVCAVAEELLPRVAGSPRPHIRTREA